MERIKIAVLDSGIAEEIKDSRVVYKKQIYWDYSEEKVIVDSKATDYNGHGTAVVETILSICPMAEIYVIKAMGISGTTSGKMLIETLKYVRHMDVQLIVLAASIVGSHKYSGLEEICVQIKKDNTVLIAAVENGKDSSIIACYDSVIGVKGAETLNVPFCFDKQAVIQMVCDASPLLVRGRKGMRYVFRGNSKATAVAAGWIANVLLQHGMQINKIYEIMERESVKLSQGTLQDEIHAYSVSGFSAEREEFYAVHDMKYRKFVYLLCEFLDSNDVKRIRQSNLIAYGGGNWIKDIDAFFDLIEERLKVRIAIVEVQDLMWAYRFYEKYIKQNED